MREQTVEISPDTVVVLESTSGDLDVHGWDEGRVLIQSSANDPADISESDTSVIVRMPCGGTQDVTLRVPRRCKLVCHQVSGQITVRDIAASVHLQSMSGDIEAEHLSGDVRIQTVSGDISIAGSQLSGLAVEAVSGDCSVETGLHPEGSYRLRSVSGDFMLQLPSDQRCTVYSQSLSGDLHCALPNEVRHEGWRRIQAAINGGGVEVRIKTTSGDVDIQSARQPSDAAPREEAAQEAPAPTGRTRKLEEEPFQAEAPTETAFSRDDLGASRMKILKAIEEGRMSVAEGLAKLRTLD